MERRRSERRNGTPVCVHMHAFVYIQCVSARCNNVTGMLQGLHFCGEGREGEKIALDSAESCKPSFTTWIRSDLYRDQMENASIRKFVSVQGRRARVDYER